jgi:RNA polymerase sigma-70 factor (ECF subfamily)
VRLTEQTSELPPDDVLVERLRYGDEDTFALLLDAWSAGMTTMARSFVSTTDTADEVVQEAWLAVFRGIDKFEGRSALKTWVYRILINIAKHRGVKESRSLPFASLLPEDVGPTIDPSRFRPSGDPYPGHWAEGQEPQVWHLPEDCALLGEARSVITEALAALPPRLRTVITLRDIEGYESAEVCELLSVSPGNQRVLLHRARAAIRARLEEYFWAMP